MEANGAGAVVLKSLFEEQIRYEVGDLLAHNDYPEAQDYLESYTRDHNVNDYLRHLKAAKQKEAALVAAFHAPAAGTPRAA